MWYLLYNCFCRDIQSYVSWAFLYFAAESNRVLILVDNRPWMMNNHSRSAEIWQLMVTKVCPSHPAYIKLFVSFPLSLHIFLQYRISPFTNTRALHKTSNTNGSKSGNNDCHEPKHTKSKRFRRWFPVINSTKLQEKFFMSVMDLSKALHGFIVFEVVWKDVHGINYLNELQVLTSSSD